MQVQVHAEKHLRDAELACESAVNWLTPNGAAPDKSSIAAALRAIKTARVSLCTCAKALNGHEFKSDASNGNARSGFQTTPLKKLRLKRHLSLKQVADAVGAEPGNLSRIERGAQRSLEVAERLANWFGRDAISELEIIYPERYSTKEAVAPALNPRTAKPVSIYETRRDNLRAVIDSHFKGNAARAAKALGFAQSSLIYTLLAASGKSRKNIGDKLARKIERIAGKPLNSLDH